MNTDINIIAYVKGPQRFIWLYTDATREECLRRIGRTASNPEIDFTWWDAAQCSQKVLKQMEAAK